MVPCCAFYVLLFTFYVSHFTFSVCRLTNGGGSTTTGRRAFIKSSTIMAGASILLGGSIDWGGLRVREEKSRVISVAAEDMLVGGKYHPDAVAKAFRTGKKELTREKTPENAWSSLFSPDDVVGIKINCAGAPRICTSLQSVRESIAGLRSAGVKENNILIRDRTDNDLRRAGHRRPEED